MPVKTVRPAHDFLHEREMTRGHVKVFSFSAESACLGKNRGIHENRIAPASMQRHEFLHVSTVCESDRSSPAHKFCRALIASPLCKLEKQHVSRERTLRRIGKAILCFVQVGSGKPNHIGRVSKSQ